VRGTVLLETTEATETHRDDLQAFTVKDLGMVLVPVPDDQTAANYLIQLVCKPDDTLMQLLLY
jgi:hypothetical protein